MYYEDLTPYVYRRWPKPPRGYKILNVGWLSAGYPYTRGKLESDCLSSLLVSCMTPAYGTKTRGFQRCLFCNWRFASTHPGAEGPCFFGNGEIRVLNGKTIYAAPTLVYHYAAIHDYLPPEEFVSALRAAAKIL